MILEKIFKRIFWVRSISITIGDYDLKKSKSVFLKRKKNQKIFIFYGKGNVTFLSTNWNLYYLKCLLRREKATKCKNVYRLTD